MFQDIQEPEPEDDELKPIFSKVSCENGDDSESGKEGNILVFETGKKVDQQSTKNHQKNKQNQNRYVRLTSTPHLLKIKFRALLLVMAEKLLSDQPSQR